MKVFIYKVAHVENDKVGYNLIITTSNLDDELSFDEVHAISDFTHEWVSAKSIADLMSGNYSKIKNNSYRGLLSNVLLYSPMSEQPKTYFIEQEKESNNG